MYQPLAPCPACARHVRALSESRCPFCGHELPSLAGAIVPSATTRLGRAATFVFGATLSIAGCAGSTGPGDARPGDDAPSATDTGGGDTGSVIQDTGTLVDTGQQQPDEGNVFPPYGIPPPEDAGAPDDQGGNQTLYGLPVNRDR
jgi:hypothetical protein